MKFNITYLFTCLFILIAVTSFGQDSTATEATPPTEVELSPEDPFKLFDMGVYSTQKAFKSRKVRRHSMWEKI